jgi:hypothetical protein
MAKYIGTLTSDMRGRVGGVVFSRSRSGVTVKAMKMPKATPSVLQSAQRAALAASLYDWRQLTNAEQVSWAAVAATLTWTNSLAQTYTPTGLMLWTQAYINAVAFGEVPPGTCGSTPSAVVPITGADLVGSSVNYVLTVYPASGTYSGRWLAYASPILPASRVYTKTIGRRPIAAVISGNFSFIGPAWTRAWGPLPSPGPSTSLRIVPCHPTYFYSGTEYIANTQFLA